jgi:hypothetical protein
MVTSFSILPDYDHYMEGEARERAPWPEPAPAADFSFIDTLERTLSAVKLTLVILRCRDSSIVAQRCHRSPVNAGQYSQIAANVDYWSCSQMLP